MPGGRDVRLLEIPGSQPGRRGSRDWLIVSTVPERVYGETALEEGLRQIEWVAPRALAHEAVVEHFLSAPAVLPMQLFTMFKEDDRALEHVVHDKRRIAAILKRVEHQVEWGLRLSWNPDTPGSPARRSAPRSGADYLERKREQRDLRAGAAETGADAGEPDVQSRLA